MLAANLHFLSLPHNYSPHTWYQLPPFAHALAQWSPRAKPQTLKLAPTIKPLGIFSSPASTQKETGTTMPGEDRNSTTSNVSIKCLLALTLSKTPHVPFKRKQKGLFATYFFAVNKTSSVKCYPILSYSHVLFPPRGCNSEKPKTESRPRPGGSLGKRNSPIAQFPVFLLYW